MWALNQNQISYLCSIVQSSNPETSTLITNYFDCKAKKKKQFRRQIFQETNF